MKVIMPCYIANTELIQLTENALLSLGNVERIIIDNASPVGGGFLRNQADVYIRNKENLGFAKAVNQGLKLAKGELVAIANNDIRVSSNWQEVAREVLSHPFIYSCHFRMLPYDEESSYGEDTWNTGKERWCTSSFFVIDNSHDFLFDENFLNSYDDWDYWTRVRRVFKTAYTNKACYQHKDSTTQQLIPQREENNKKNAEYFIKKHGMSAEKLFEQLYPEQLKQNWRPFP